MHYAKVMGFDSLRWHYRLLRLRRTATFFGFGEAKDAVRTLTAMDDRGDDATHELFIVEGESAADAVEHVCNPTSQRVHPIQGKPMNVVRASEKTIWANDRVRMLHHRIVGSPSAHLVPGYVPLGRVILVTDANADGVHAKALLLALIDEVMPELIRDDRVFTIRAPTFGITCTERRTPVFAYSSEGRQSVMAQLADRGATKLSTQHYAGLASMSADELSFAFTNRATRRLSALNAPHVAAARAALG